MLQYVLSVLNKGIISAVLGRALTGIAGRIGIPLIPQMYWNYLQLCWIASDTVSLSKSNKLEVFSIMSQFSSNNEHWVYDKINSYVEGGMTVNEWLTWRTYLMLVKLTFDLFNVISNWFLFFYNLFSLQEPCKDIFKVILVGRKVNWGRAGHAVLTGGAANGHDDLHRKQHDTFRGQNEITQYM